MHSVELMGQRLTARDVDRQVTEFRVRVAALLSFYALGIPVAKAAGESCSGKAPDRQIIYATNSIFYR